MEKYDGLVDSTYFRHKETGKIYDLNECNCRFDILYDYHYRYNGTEEFSSPKIVAKKNNYTKTKKNKM